MTAEFERPGESLDLSPAVRTAVDRVTAEEEITAAALAQAVTSAAQEDPDSGEFIPAKEIGVSLETSDQPDAERRSVRAWLEAVRGLFDPDRVPRLDARVVLLGLGLLDRSLQRRLQETEMLPALEDRFDRPLTDVLTEAGRSRRFPADTVPTQPDRPLERPENDEFQRVAFARYLARRIYDVSSSEAYAIHLYGPWGSGKSTLLNFLETELRTEGGTDRGPADDGSGNGPPEGSSEAMEAAAAESWQVVRFNAWQHQHVDPPWWALMDHVFQQSKSTLGTRDRLAEYWWRLRSGRFGFFLGIVVLTWLGALSVPFLIQGVGGLGGFASAVDSIGKILAVVVTVWGGVQAASSSLLVGSAQAARSYVDYVGDPMNTIKRRFNVLIDRIPTPVAIFIDDLDRCDCTYVVDLLEGVQTLFTEAPVVFVVASDRRWLTNCFEEEYATQQSTVSEPGTSLGELFLEKTFQFSTSVPVIPEPMKETYWDGLLELAPAESTGGDAGRPEPVDAMRAAETEEEILHVVDESRDRPFAEQQSIREEAVIRLAAPEIVERTEHVLGPLAPLLEPNPRAMKRLVNAYSVNRALATLAHVSITRDHLALWTILSLQYPRLARFLEANPGMVDRIGGDSPPDVDPQLAGLFTDDRVVDIVRGRPVEAALDRETVARCARIRQE